MLKWDVGYIVYGGFQLQHISGPLVTFESVGGFGETPYQPKFLSETGGMIESSSGLCMASEPFSVARQMDIIFVSGGFASNKAEKSPAIAAFLQRQAPGCRHLAAVGSGTLVLAASGLLDGRRAVTHWALNSELRENYPAIQVQNDEFIVRDDKLWTTSSLIGGIELARLMVMEDLGKTAAQRATRDLLNYYHKPADDEGYTKHSEHRFNELIAWARENLTKPLSVERLAERVEMSPRHFVSAFANATGQTPAKAIERIRLEAAFSLVEKTELGFADIAQRTGFGTSERMRRSFIRAFAEPPKAMREVVRRRRRIEPETPV